jgi:GNAT superfamily N-acetyltransferase
MGYAARVAASISAYDPADRAALRAFQLAHFGPSSRQADDRYFEWLFEKNPSRQPGEPALWVCKRDGLVVGQQARLPAIVKAGTEEHRGAWGVDLMVHPEWRLKGVGPALFAQYERSCDLLLGLGLSDSSYRICMRAGWTDMGMLPLIARPLDIEACAEALRNRRWLARLIPGGLVRGSARALGAVVGTLRGCKLERVPAFDERVEGLWSRASLEYPVLVKRDFRALRWRFDETPEPARYERYYLTRRGELLGYAVLRMDTWRGHKVARVVDHLCLRAWTAPLVALVVDAMRGRNAAAVFLERLAPQPQEALTALGCFPVGAVTRFVVKATQRSSASALGDAARWFVTHADSDSDVPHIAAAATAVSVEKSAKPTAARPRRELVDTAGLERP